MNPELKKVEPYTIIALTDDSKLQVAVVENYDLDATYKLFTVPGCYSVRKGKEFLVSQKDSGITVTPSMHSGVIPPMSLTFTHNNKGGEYDVSGFLSIQNGIHAFDFESLRPFSANIFSYTALIGEDGVALEANIHTESQLYDVRDAPLEDLTKQILYDSKVYGGFGITYDSKNPNSQPRLKSYVLETQDK